MKRRIVPVVALLASLSAHAARGETLSPLQQLFFLIGTWTSSGPDNSTGGTVFSLSLQGQVMLRTNFAAYPAQGDKPASRHDDLMVIYPSGRVWRADYYDNEGHVIRYSVVTPRTGTALFVSDEVPQQPRYRLTYVLRGDGLAGTFEVAPPGQPEGFKTYLTWKSQKASTEDTPTH